MWKEGFDTQLIEAAFVYHKRRSTLKQFYRQTYAFGKARPMLNRRYPSTAKLTYWFPSLFVLGVLGSVFAGVFNFYVGLSFYLGYFGLLLIHALITTRNGFVATLTTVTTLVQFLGYGLGFLNAILKRGIQLKKQLLSLG